MSDGAALLSFMRRSAFSAPGWCTAMGGVFQPSNRSRNMTCTEPAHSWDTGATQHCFVCSSASSAAHR